MVVFEVGTRVVARHQPRIHVAMREHVQQAQDAGLDKQQAGGFQRLHEPAGQSDGDDIAVPELLPLAGDEAQGPRLCLRLSVEVAQQRSDRLVFAHEIAAVDHAVAGAVLQRNSPLPAGGTRGGSRVRRGIADAVAGNGDRTVAGQPVAPVLVTGLERLFDQQPAEAGAIDEEVAGDAATVFHYHSAHESRFRHPFHVDHLSFHPLDTQAFGECAKVAGVQRRIEVIGIRDVGERRRRRYVVGAGQEPVFARRERLQLIGADITHVLACHQQAQPVVMERGGAGIVADRSEAVHIAVADARPVAELDAELEGALRGTHELGLIQPECLRVERSDVRHGRFADADDADLVRLHQPHLAASVQMPDQCRRRHPAGGATAHHDDLANRIPVHLPSPI